MIGHRRVFSAARRRKVIKVVANNAKMLDQNGSDCQRRDQKMIQELLCPGDCIYAREVGNRKFQGMQPRIPSNPISGNSSQMRSLLRGVSVPRRFSVHNEVSQTKISIDNPEGRSTHKFPSQGELILFRISFVAIGGPEVRKIFLCSQSIADESIFFTRKRSVQTPIKRLCGS